MKTFVALVALFVLCVHGATLTDEQKTILKAFHNDCLKESKVSESVVEAAKNGTLPDDPKLKAHLLCIGQRSGVQNEAGEFQKPVLIEKLTKILKDREAVEKLVEKCAVFAESGEQSAYNWAKCCRENSPEPITYF